MIQEGAKLAVMIRVPVRDVILKMDSKVDSKQRWS